MLAVKAELRCLSVHCSGVEPGGRWEGLLVVDIEVGHIAIEDKWLWLEHIRFWGVEDVIGVLVVAKLLLRKDVVMGSCHRGHS